MKIPIINIGNSKGIILSRTILERYGFGANIELVMEQNHLELKPVAPPRQGWDVAFKKMHEAGDDQLLIETVQDDDFLEEWK